MTDPRYEHVRAAGQAFVKLRFEAVLWQRKRTLWLDMVHRWRSDDHPDPPDWLVAAVQETNTALNQNLEAQEQVLGLVYGALGRYGLHELELDTQGYWQARKDGIRDAKACVERMLG